VHGDAAPPGSMPRAWRLYAAVLSVMLGSVVLRLIRRQGGRSAVREHEMSRPAHRRALCSDKERCFAPLLMTCLSFPNAERRTVGNSQ